MRCLLESFPIHKLQKSYSISLFTSSQIYLQAFTSGLVVNRQDLFNVLAFIKANESGSELRYNNQQRTCPRNVPIFHYLT